MRIYKRETLDEEHPLHQVKQEKAQAAIEGLLKLFSPILIGTDGPKLRQKPRLLPLEI